MTTRMAARTLLALTAAAWLGAIALRASGAAPTASARAAGAARVADGAPVASALALDVDPAPPPARLSATGLYADAATLTVDPRNRPFAPQYPLWSDGAAKRRWVRLPDGATIDGRDPDQWDFPVGTRFWKEFVFDGQRVETRMLWKTRPDRWEFATYAWTDDGRDAMLVAPGGLDRAAEVAPGKWHRIPSREECRACHDSGRTEALGFTALQLSDDRDPLAPHAEPVTPDMVTLGGLIRESRLAGVPAGAAGTAPRIAGRTASERAVLGYLSTNCGSCHNRRSSIASLGLFLKYSLASAGRCAPDAIATTLDQPGHWQVPDAPANGSRVVAPGAPAHSALLRRTTSRRPSSQMPPIGTVVADRDAVALLTAWISGLSATPATLCGSS